MGFRGAWARVDLAYTLALSTRFMNMGEKVKIWRRMDLTAVKKSNRYLNLK